MTTFSKLDEVRDAARARAVEDFEYFANYVLGANLPPAVCLFMQGQYEKRTEEVFKVQFPAFDRQRVLESTFSAWLVVLGEMHTTALQGLRTTETFLWLFEQELLQRAA